MMTKLLFTTHWSAQEAMTIFEFLGELQDVIWSAYETEIIEIVHPDEDQSPDNQKSLHSNSNVDIDF